MSVETRGAKGNGERVRIRYRDSILLFEVWEEEISSKYDQEPLVRRS